MRRTASGISISRSVPISWSISGSGIVCAISARVNGFRVLGFWAGAGGGPGRSAARLYQVAGASASSSRNLVFSMIGASLSGRVDVASFVAQRTGSRRVRAGEQQGMRLLDPFDDRFVWHVVEFTAPSQEFHVTAAVLVVGVVHTVRKPIDFER